MIKLREGSFLSKYMQSLADMETPVEFDLWTGLWLIGNVLGRETVVDRPRVPVRMNWFIVLAGESGIMRKSTSVRYASTLLDKVNTSLGLDIRNVQTKITAQKIEQYLNNDTELKGCSHVTLTPSEMTSIFGTGPNSSTVPELLTDLYDCPEHRTGGGSLRGGTTNQRNVFVSMLTASTPSWLFKRVTPTVIEGGFTSRTIFVHCEAPKMRNPWPLDLSCAEQEGLYTALLSVAQIYRNRKIGLTKEARDAFESWYKRRKISIDPFTASFAGREHDHVLRVAGCLGVDNASADVGTKATATIDKDTLVSAISLIAGAREMGSSLFSGSYIQDKLAIQLEKVRSVLLRAGPKGIPQAQLRTMVRTINQEDLVKYLSTLLEVGAVKKFVVHDPMKKGRPPTWWIATDELRDPQLLVNVARRL